MAGLHTGSSCKSNNLSNLMLIPYLLYRMVALFVLQLIIKEFPPVLSLRKDHGTLQGSVTMRVDFIQVGTLQQDHCLSEVPVVMEPP